MVSENGKRVWRRLRENRGRGFGEWKENLGTFKRDYWVSIGVILTF